MKTLRGMFSPWQWLGQVKCLISKWLANLDIWTPPPSPHFRNQSFWIFLLTFSKLRWRLLWRNFWLGRIIIPLTSWRTCSTRVTAAKENHFFTIYAIIVVGDLVVYNFFFRNWSGKDALTWHHLACSLKNGEVGYCMRLSGERGVLCWLKDRGGGEEIIYTNSVTLGVRFLGVRCFRSIDHWLIAKGTTGDCVTWVCI